MPLPSINNRASRKGISHPLHTHPFDRKSPPSWGCILHPQQCFFIIFRFFSHVFSIDFLCKHDVLIYLNRRGFLSMIELFIDRIIEKKNKEELFFAWSKAFAETFNTRKAVIVWITFIPFHYHTGSSRSNSLAFTMR